MFVQTTCGGAVRIDTVREIRPRDEGTMVTLRLDDGAERIAKMENWHRALEAQTLKLVPAHPGTYVLHETARGQLIDREPVIAWAIPMQACFVHPITSGGFNNPPEHDPLILHPDGTVQNGLGIYPTYGARMQEYGYEQGEAACPVCEPAAE